MLSHYSDWLELENGIAGLLPCPGQAGDRTRLLQALSHYARAAVATARSTQLDVPTSDEARRALQWLRKPVFICGHHRSGTTLLQQLLDGHPALLVLPSEGTYFTSFDYVARAEPAAHDLDRFIADWIARLVDPNYAPHFKLGRSTSGYCPSVHFARRILAWRDALPRIRPDMGRFIPLLALAAAYQDVTCAACRPRRWVEKTPLNEHHVRRFAIFPEARFIHVVRDPRATLASLLERLRYLGACQVNPATHAHAIAHSMHLARKHAHRNEAGYLVVRYEDLTTRTEATMQRVCTFLGIPADAATYAATFRGRGVSANSSYAHHPSPSERRCAALSPSETRLIDGLTACIAPTFGYAVNSIPVPRQRFIGLRNIWLRVANRLRCLAARGARRQAAKR